MRPAVHKLIAVILGVGGCLLAAGSSPGPASGRGGASGISADEYKAITAALRRFDLQLGPSEQAAIRELDSRLRKLPENESPRYLAVMRRYHDWLASLPDAVRQKVLDAPPSGRMAVVKQTVARYPVPSDETPYWLRLSEMGGGSPSELAAVVRVWGELTPEQRREVDRLPLVAAKRERIFKFGRAMKLAREIRPPDFRPEEWIPKAEARVDELRWIEGELQAPITRAEAKAEAASKTKGEAKAKLRPAVLERLALNLYFLSHPAAPVMADRLDAFFRTLPSWVQTGFDAYSADEARRKLTEIYRLVYPHPSEFRPATPARISPSPGKTDSSSSAPRPSPVGPKAAPAGSGASPF
ncbi:hypothetical protein OJF2_21570 [Aquisphaera giovannonii]|uniref:DUF3106 domain-containing protein n=1 Tax=Aquisphaera giovannonii TaxID=406548 RepID=A0A5B9VZA4_9BACT|nr:hypothetical protein [Aquisphaera giovannonii]QEH33653.1 hypothetical protein OJF2_21570 [Aquisphaera giovannonii]